MEPGQERNLTSKSRQLACPLQNEEGRAGLSEEHSTFIHREGTGDAQFLEVDPRTSSLQSLGLRARRGPKLHLHSNRELDAESKYLK